MDCEQPDPRAARGRSAATFPDDEHGRAGRLAGSAVALRGVGRAEPDRQAAIVTAVLDHVVIDPGSPEPETGPRAGQASLGRCSARGAGCRPRAPLARSPAPLPPSSTTARSGPCEVANLTATPGARQVSRASADFLGSVPARPPLTPDRGRTLPALTCSRIPAAPTAVRPSCAGAWLRLRQRWCRRARRTLRA